MISGVDGCKGGWLVAVSSGWPCVEMPGLEFCHDFCQVLKATESCKVVVVDMPIGIPSGGEYRDCDILARKELGKARNRVFLTPSRQCLQADTPEEFQEIHRRLRGKGAGLPLWGILPKLREVDGLMSPGLQGRILEFHPELVWKKLGGKVLNSKHTTEGILQRIGLIERYIPNIGYLDSYQAVKKAKIDDVLDAVVGLAAAHFIATGPDYSRRLPVREPTRDERGLRMEIWS